MFWRKKNKEEKDKKRQIMKIEGPLWGYMVHQHRVMVEQLQNLRRVEQHGLVGDKPVTMVRIFHPDQAERNGINIEDYQSLNSNPELILYEGYYQGSREQIADIHIEKIEKLTS